MKYKIVATLSNKDLVKKVNDLLKKGWKLQGGVATTLVGPRIVLAQALIKKEANQ